MVCNAAVMFLYVGRKVVLCFFVFREKIQSSDLTIKMLWMKTTLLDSSKKLKTTKKILRQQQLRFTPSTTF